MSSFLKEAREGDTRISSARAFQTVGASKSKTITKLLDRFMNGGLEFCNDKEITPTLTLPDTIRAAVGRDLWSKKLGKTSVKKHVNKCGCFIN